MNANCVDQAVAISTCLYDERGICEEGFIDSLSVAGMLSRTVTAVRFSDRSCSLVGASTREVPDHLTLVAAHVVRPALLVGVRRPEAAVTRRSVACVGTLGMRVRVTRARRWRL